MCEALAHLRTRFEEHQRRPFPRDGAEPATRLAHADLAAYDARVAGVATRVLENAPVDPEWLEPDTQLGARLARAPASGTAEAGLLLTYREYARSLDELLAAARAALAGTADAC